MKIALIDIGVSKKAVENRMEVRHFLLNNGEMEIGRAHV